MVIVERRNRKGPVLTPSSLPCLRGLATLNVTEGCAHGCAYCYTRGYMNYPGDGRVVLLVNTPKLVKEELSRKRRRPQRVYFSPSSDPFQPLPEVQDLTHQSMALLLNAGVEVAFLTKGTPGDRFFSLFANKPSRVFAQIGITTLDKGLWNALEPGTAPPEVRLANIDALTGIRVATTARLDPLVPGLTDTDENLLPLLAELRKRNVQTIAASYLFLRPAFAHRVSDLILRLSRGSPLTTDWEWRTFADGEGGGRTIGKEERSKRFAHLRELAEQHGMTLHVCTCKNPDLAGEGCGIAGPPWEPSRAGTLPLFPPTD